MRTDVSRFKGVELSKDGETEGEMCVEQPLKSDTPVTPSEDEAHSKADYVLHF